MSEVVSVGSIVESNGKTIYENNMARSHNIPIGALVEVKYDKYHGDGACEKVHARLWVVKHGRDCDGTPLYRLSKVPLSVRETDIQIILDNQWRISGDKAANIFHGSEGGFTEEDLTVIEVTEEIKKGVDSLKW